MIDRKRSMHIATALGLAWLSGLMGVGCQDSDAPDSAMPSEVPAEEAAETSTSGVVGEAAEPSINPLKKTYFKNLHIHTN